MDDDELAARLRAVLPVADVEDVLQETFLAAWRGAGGYQPQQACGGWLWGIARRQAALALRRRGPAPRSAELAANIPSPDDPLQAALSRLDLDEALTVLGHPDREVWRLMYVEDRPVAEIAGLLGIPEGTVKSRAHRVARSANVGVAAGLAGWAITILGGQAATGTFTVAVQDSVLFLPYLAFAAACAAITLCASRVSRGTS